jgi:hypothetical protein
MSLADISSECEQVREVLKDGALCFVVLRQKHQLISEIQNKLLRNSLVKQSLPAPKDTNSMFSTLQDASTADLSQVLGDVKKYASEVVTQDRSIGMSFPWESEKGERSV